MHRFKLLTILSAFMLATALSLAFARPPKDITGSAGAAGSEQKDQDKDKTAPAVDDSPLISKLRVQDFPGTRYFYTQHEATIEKLPEIIPPAMQAMEAVIKEQNVPVKAAPIFVYHGVTQDMSKPFQLQIGFPVEESAKEVGEMKVRDLEPFHCATVIYSGPVMQVGSAYQQLFTELFAAGLTPNGETREMYLHFESPESPNNIMLIMAGVNK